MSANFLEQLAALPANLSNHLKITVIALAVGVMLSVPLAVFLARRKELGYPALTVAGVIQTIPSLALLALMVPLFDATGGLGLGLSSLGFYPAIIALTLYSLLPILRNTVTGILGVDPAMTEAARGVGMTNRQILWRVELPLAAPVIIAGIRTATVWLVSIATLATPVGQKCLGDYIFTGLQTRNWTMVLFGVVGAGALAILLDLLIAGLQRAAEERRRVLGWVSAGSLMFVLLGGLVSPSLVAWAHRGRETATGGALAARQHEQNAALGAKRSVIRVGGKNFTEQYILQHVIADVLQNNGYQTRRMGSLGSTIVFDALAGGDIDVYVDYSGTIWANHMKRIEPASRWQVLAEVQGWLAKERGIRCLGSLGFENTYAFAMQRKEAERLGVHSIADLAPLAPKLKMGADYEFLGRPEWKAVRSQYGLNFREKVRFDPTLMYEAIRVGQADVISAFSTDGRIAAYDLALLEDSLGVIPPYDAIVLIGPTVADDAKLAKALAPLIGSIPVALMQKANYRVDRDEHKETAAEAATWLLGEISGG